jgi:hypothetical protein
MKTTRWLSLLILPALLGGCQNMSHTEKGVLGGGAIGATTGALIGSTTKHTGAGAVLGGAVGALSGGLIGNALDKQEQKADMALAAASAPVSGPLSLQQIVQMAQGHISDQVIINQIRTTGSVYYLNPNEIRWLKENGVSDAVVMEMQATASRAPRRVYRETVVQPVYVVEPPPPPVGIGIGFGYRHGWR